MTDLAPSAETRLARLVERLLLAAEAFLGPGDGVSDGSPLVASSAIVER